MGVCLSQVVRGLVSVRGFMNNGMCGVVGYDGDGRRE